MLKRSGSRSISVEGHHYRYVVSERGDDVGDGIPIGITVQDEQSNGSRLVIRGLTTRLDPYARAKNYQGRAVGTPIGPRHVAALVRLAVARGWVPTSSGGQFEMQTGNHEVTETGGQADR